jgi:plastocyanin
VTARPFCSKGCLFSQVQAGGLQEPAIIKRLKGRWSMQCVGWWRIAASIALAAALAIAACSSRAPGDTQPSPTPAPDATITITSSGASPKNLVVSPGSQVLFINSDSRDHQMYSDPHPEHTDCPEFDQVGSLAPGQRRQTGNLNTIRTCGFHDHINFENQSLRGTVTIR